jgi:hypothetical protein
MQLSVSVFSDWPFLIICACVIVFGDYRLKVVHATVNLHKMFEQFDLKITAEVNLNVVIF